MPMFGSLLASSSVKVLKETLYDLVHQDPFGLRSYQTKKSPPTSIVMTKQINLFLVARQA